MQEKSTLMMKPHLSQKKLKKKKLKNKIKNDETASGKIERNNGKKII